MHLKKQLEIQTVQETENDSQSYWGTVAHNFAKGEGGYYYMDNGDSYLMFFDEETQESYPLCALPNCQHNMRRYGMGEICAKMADFSILTEDNNRFEKVEDILADIRVGMNKGNPEAKFVEIPDRLDALHYAVDHAQEGDLIAVIGKGHETYRDREGVKTPFLERELLEEYAQQKGLE